MKLFAGLGNPGTEYARNRHNIGFMALDRIAEDHGFSPWKAKFQGRIAEGRLGREKVLLLKPETYMNRSGQSLGEAMRFYKLEPDDITVFHDELDLAPGKCRAKTGGGHAGHNGLRSIHAHVGEAYHRIRLGIGHPGRKELVSGYVLHDFAKADEAWLDDLIRGLSDGAPALAEGDTARFMNAVSLRTAPPRSGGGGRPAQPGKGDGKTKGQGKGEDKGQGQGKPAPSIASGATAHGVTAPAPGPGAAPTAPTTGARAAAPPEAPEDDRSALQKLVDKFK